MLDLILVRHATTPLNEAGRYQGHSDPALSDRGQMEARLLGDLLADRKFDLFVASDLRRCVQTLSIALPKATPRLDPRLRELDFGDWDGCSWEECRAAHPDLMAAWTENPVEATPPGGEPFAHFTTRIIEALDDLPPHGSVLMVGHGGTIRWILARTIGLTWRQATSMELSACGICRLALYDEGGHVRSWNEMEHLRPIQPPATTGP
jgi:broad specificity phosphatase PhoE